MSVRIGGIRRLRLMGGGAAESNDEARVKTGLVDGGGRALSSPSRKMAGPMLWSHHGMALKSRLEGRDSRSVSSSGNKEKEVLEDLAAFLESSPLYTGSFDTMPIDD